MQQLVDDRPQRVAARQTTTRAADDDEVGLHPCRLFDQPVGVRVVEADVGARDDVGGYRRTRFGKPVLGLLGEVLVVPTDRHERGHRAIRRQDDAHLELGAERAAQPHPQRHRVGASRRCQITNDQLHSQTTLHLAHRCTDVLW